MKKLSILLLSLLLLAGCSAKPKDEERPTPLPNKDQTETYQNQFKILVPKGATAVPFAGLMKEGGSAVEAVDGTDVIQAALVSPNPEYDVIVAPTNLGAKLASAEKSQYKLAYVLTWGNLYLVSEDDQVLAKDGNFAAFGEAAVPGKVLATVLSGKTIKPQLQYFNAVSDVQVSLLTKKAVVGLMAEPAATAVIAKGKENNLNLKIIMDLQEEWKKATGTDGYPQAAIFVRKDKYDAEKAQMEAMFKSLEDYINTASTTDKAILASDIDTVTAEKIGVPSSAVAAATWDRLNIKLRPGKEVKPELEAFLKLFDINSLEHILIEE